MMSPSSKLHHQDFATTVARLEAAFARPLPGLDAQLLMAPRPRPGWKAGHIPPDATTAGGLLLVYPRNDRAHVVLTVRSRHLPTHKGQVSLPGGMQEPGESLVETALREAEEEVGVRPAAVRLLGELTPLDIPVSGFVVHPFVGCATADPEAYPVTGEVERVLDVPVSLLADPACLGLESKVLLQRDRQAPYFGVDGELVWGATAMILAEFLTMLGAPPVI